MRLVNGCRLRSQNVYFWCAIFSVIFFCSNAMAQLQTYIHFESENGDLIGQGKVVTVTEDNGDFSAKAAYNKDFTKGVNISFNGNDSKVDGWWDASFEATNGELLESGKTYSAATRFPFNASETPGLSFSGSGRGCNKLFGEFTILHIEYGDAGVINSFAADFVQHCEQQDAPALRGEVRYNFDGPANCELPDSDNDGIVDVADACEATPVGENIDENGCSQDQSCSKHVNIYACYFADFMNDEPYPANVTPNDCSFQRNSETGEITCFSR